MGASCSFGALHKDFRNIIGAVEMDVVAGGDFDDAPEGEPAGTLHRKGDGVKLHGRAGNIGYGNAVALGDTDVDAIEIGLDGLRGHVVSEPFPHGLGGEMSRSRGGNADPAVMARPEDTLLGFVVRDQIHCAFAGFGDHCVEIDDMAEALRDALGDRRQDNPRVAVPHKHNVSQVFNAETFIIGLCSGLMGIGLSRLLLIPGNMLIQKIAVGTSVVAVLPWKAAVVLVALATVLTILGGFIPAKTASRSDPVKALRAE